MKFDQVKFMDGGVFVLRDIRKGKFVCVYDSMMKTDIFKEEFHEDKEYWMRIRQIQLKFSVAIRILRTNLELVNDAKRVK